MFERLKEKMRSLVGDRVFFDPSSLNDPVATQTEWTPARGGGASFRTHKLVAVNSDRMEFRASTGAVLFYLLFLLIGTGVALVFLFSGLSAKGSPLDADTIIPVLIGLVFSCAGGLLLYFGTAPVVFDKRRGYFWKGRKAPDELLDKASLKFSARLEEIYAIQLISEYCRGNKSSYYSFELNIVLDNGKRINVVDHGNLSRLREDAAALSRFLGKPLWDAID